MDVQFTHTYTHKKEQIEEMAMCMYVCAYVLSLSSIQKLICFNKTSKFVCACYLTCTA